MKWGSYRGRVPTLFAEVKEVQKMEWKLEIDPRVNMAPLRGVLEFSQVLWDTRPRLERSWIHSRKKLRSHHLQRVGPAVEESLTGSRTAGSPTMV